MKKATADQTHAQHVPCAKMNLAMETTLVCVAVATLVPIVILRLIHAPPMEILAQTVLHVLH